MRVIQESPVAAALERGLRERIRGEVRFDVKSRLLYSTDASVYQVLPLGVVLPRDAQDVEVAVRLAAEHGVPVLPRGGGTSLAGQAVGAALVLDFSKFMNRILEIDPERRLARVEPGVRLDRLQLAAKPHGLWFGPDPATIRQCNVGGMIGNNSCGARSLVYGKTGDHVHTVDCIMADGGCTHFGAMPREAIAGAPGREGELARRVLEILEPHRARIEARYPDIPRRVSGYNFDALLGKPALNLADLIVGSEGTLATVVEATMGLVPIPSRQALVLLAFRDRFSSFDAVPHILPEAGLTALEIVDSRVLDGARKLFEYRPVAELVPPDALGVLFCEFAADDGDAVAELAHAFAGRASHLPGAPWAGVFLAPHEQVGAWALRQAATGLLYLTTPTKDIKPQEFVEDTGVPPARLGEYTRRFEEIVARHGTRTGYFGHAGQGCLHIRVDLDLKRGDDVRRMQAIAQDVAELVVEFGGSLSGEHGDGLARSEFLPLMFGPEIIALHRDVKHAFDPDNRMNPGGKIVPPYQRMSENLRFGEAYSVDAMPETFYDYPEDGGWDRAVEKCNGMAVCRKLDTGTMCPSYMVLLEEEHATRGRANALREAMRGNLPGMKSTEVLEALDLCLECKACKTECPVGVDMARYKSEFLAQHYKATGHTPAAARFFGNINRFARLGSMAPRLSNLGARITAPLVRRASHVDPRRDLPEFAPETFRRWFERREKQARKNAVRGTRASRGIGASRGPASGQDAGDSRPTVILLDDTFYNHFQPEPLKAAVTVLERAGYRVELPRRQVCCGRSMISKGLLKEVKPVHRTLIDVLAPQVEAGAALVGLEPSCILTFRDELPDLTRDPRTELLKASAYTLEEFLLSLPDYQPGRLQRRAVVHGHCHQKALVGMGPTTELFNRVDGLDFTVLDSGCCGLAGSFGYDEKHYDVSQAVGERVLFPAVRAAAADDLVVAPGFSCRTQIKDFCDGRRVLHPAELLAMAE
jgi:FAD/FMN-containing dehydrogenase/Fe-S oxidoreductase